MVHDETEPRRGVLAHEVRHCALGAGIVPHDDFTLAPGDRIRIAIDPIGVLDNYVVQDAA